MKIFSIKSIGVLLLISSCAQTPPAIDIDRHISSEADKYILNSDAAVKRIREVKASPLSDGQCFADPETKIYLSNIKSSATGNFRELKSQINVTNLENSASTEFYFCRVTCLLNNRYAAFWTTLTDSPGRHNDDNAFICQGISMEQVNIPGTSLSTLGPVVHNISAFDMQEVLPRLKEVNYKITPATKAELDKKTFENFKIISRAYITSTMPAMIEAGAIMDMIAYQREGYKEALDKYLLMLKKNNGQIKGDFSSDYFIMLNLLQNGRHMLYEKL
jgi:hypothetical protein